MHDFEIALGRYLLYLGLLELTEPERKLYLAINHLVYHTLFQQPTFQVIRQRFQISLLVVNIVSQEVERWID